ncbi:hypothetical protein HQ563_16490 [bacterium]|nr:hypothetical protein [bacterium]
MSYGKVVRLQYRVRTSRAPTEGELRAICNRIIKREKERKPHNALSFLFYLPDTDPHGFFTAGKAEWAPDGIWGDAAKMATGDYSRHKLAVDCRNALSEISPGPSEATDDRKSDVDAPKEPSAWEEFLRAARPRLGGYHSVGYRVSSYDPLDDKKVFVTYINGLAGIEQEEVRIPADGSWEEILGNVKSGTFLSISAQNQGPYYGIRAAIWVDGKEWKRSVCWSEHGMASCSGILGHK